MDPNQAIRSARTRVKQTTTAAGREAASAFSLEGTRSLERALRANTPLSQVWFSDSAWKQPSEREAKLLAMIDDRGIPCQVLPDEVMSELTEGRKFGSCLALAPLPTLQPIQVPGVYVVGVDIVDPGNVGAMICIAFVVGASGFILFGDTELWYSKVVCIFMGSIFKLPICVGDA